MSAKHQELWRLWLAFYLTWTAATAVWIYDDAKQATQILLKSNDLNVDHQIATCDTMNKLAAQEGQDQKLMELYFTIYQKNELGNVLEEIRAFDALEVYFLAESGKTYIASECPLAGEHIIQGIERLGAGAPAAGSSLHPIEIFARACGIEI